MGQGRRRRSYSDSSGSESDSESDAAAAEGDGAGRQSNSGSDQDADNWVLCDRCTKWRRIPAGFADQIREDTPWYCEHNPNKAFASCSVAQELTNEEIDAAGDSDESDHDEESLKRRRIPAVWQLLKDNILAHRKHKLQDEDDIMICHCKPMYRGGDGCGPDCINRMLCIECVPGFCPSEEKCTNQMFSKRMYANLEIRRAGAKGFGLFALEDIKAGQFIIEYIGEVLEEDEYQRRKDYYMSVGQRHYYFMNIGNGEVIDACRKGNISRFINHSCEPNCETQKWLVKGELAIGLFAVRDIPKDTELTFDYNFERYGDKPMRCYCRSTNCRKFIGGMQDNFDVSLLPPVEPDDVSSDLPPIMLTDADMDPNMRMLLEWRVGVKVDKTKEVGMVTRLERVCKARNVTWTVKHFYGQEPPPAPQQLGLQQSVAVPPGASVRGTDKAPAVDAVPALAPAKAKQQRKAEKVAAGAATTGTASKGKASGTNAAKQQSEGSTHAAGVAKLRIDDGAGSTTPAAGSGPAAGQAARQAPSITPEVAQVRGPKALFKQWKIMQQQDATPAPAVEEKPAATPSSPPSPRSPHSPPSPHSPQSPRSSLSLDNDDSALDELRTAATEAAKHVPLRKRLKRLLPKTPVAERAGAHTAAQNGGAAGNTAPRRSDGSAAGILASATPAAGMTSSVGVGRKNSLGTAGAPPAATTVGLSYSPPRSTSPPPSTTGRGSSAARKLRSEIDRRLEEVVGSTGRLKDPSRQSIIKVLRLFNLCDIGGAPTRNTNGFGAAAGGRYLNGGMSRNADDIGIAGPGPGSTSASGALSARQRARMADLSLLLDVVLKTTSSAAKKELVTCGLLTQLHQAMGRNTSKEYCVILRKVLRAVEGLPLDANNVYAVRSAHGNFADMLRQLSSNADYDVRTKATALLKKFPPSAVTDQRLLQLMAAPPVRFGHGRGGGGMGGSGLGGMRMGGFAGNNMMPLAMQQQIMQQQQQMLLMKQQQMLRMKESAAAAAAAANCGLPPPPSLMPGGASIDADPASAAGSLPRTSSAVSLDDAMDMDQAQNGPAGLPPLGPGRQRAMAVAAAAAAALANRPGLLRPMMGRPGVLGGMAGPMVNGMGPMGMGPMGGGGAGRGGMMGMMGMGPSPLGLPPRPPSPAHMDMYAGYNGTGAGDDGFYNSSKRRKFSHPHGLDSAAGSDAAGGQLPGPPPRPPYSLGGVHHMHRHSGCDGGDASDREPPGPPPLPPNMPLPPPPPHPSHAFRYHQSGSEDRDPAADLPARLSVEQIFALQRPLVRPPLLPPVQGQIQPERHVHGQLTDAVMLFALGLYGSCWPTNPAPAAAITGQPKERQPESPDEAGAMSPLIHSSDPPMSPVLEAPPQPTAGKAPQLELPLPPPPQQQQQPGGTCFDSSQLRPLRTHSTALGAAAGGPSPYHQQGSPAQYGGWDGLPGTAGAGTGSASSTPTISGFGSGPQPGGGGFMQPASAPNSATAAAAGLPPVVPISSLSDWRLPPPAPSTGIATDAAAAAAAPAMTGSAPLPPMLRGSPHTSPEHLGAAGAAGRAGAQAAANAGAAEGEDVENIDEWLRPVSTQHADAWDEPDQWFEAYVADMVRHRLGKYMQPEHPSRVSVPEAAMLRAKVYREVVAKERRAWDERRSAGVYKPIERHKLEANLKEFVRSTIKRMRDREKEKATGVPVPSAPGQGHYSAGRSVHGPPGSSSHLQQRPSLSTPYGLTPPPPYRLSSEGSVPRTAFDPPRLTPSPPPDMAPAEDGTTGCDDEARTEAVQQRVSAPDGQPAEKAEEDDESSRAMLAAAAGSAGPIAVGCGGAPGAVDVSVAEATAA